MTLSATFTLNWPGDALFGAGRVDQLGEVLAARGQNAALIVTDAGVEAAGAARDARVSSGGTRRR